MQRSEKRDLLVLVKCAVLFSEVAPMLTYLPDLGRKSLDDRLNKKSAFTIAFLSFRT